MKSDISPSLLAQAEGQGTGVASAGMNASDPPQQTQDSVSHGANQGPYQDAMRDILNMKYAHPGEASPQDVRQRIANALALGLDQRVRFGEVLEAGFTPGGRIAAAAGSELITTMINCFVQPIGDTVEGFDEQGQPGIAKAFADAMSTMRRGGGVGYDFSALRPRGAWVKGTNSTSSGPVSYMRVFDRMCETIESAGARRGAQMGVLRVDHPDIREFINAKATPDFVSQGLPQGEVQRLMGLMGEHQAFGWAMRKAFATLSNFNISVAITDEFIAAVDADAMFNLVHDAVPASGCGLRDEQGNPVQVVTDDGPRYVYETVKARDLLNEMLQNAYNSGDPGMLMISLINRVNNLRGIEVIKASNPCGEQMLPAYGCCCLGAVDIAAFVRDPFETHASLDQEGLAAAVAGGVEMLDRVLDVTRWPLPEQALEAQQKRRIGLGYYGLADAMAMLGVVYGTEESVAFTEQVGQLIAHAAYRASVSLAVTHGAFPLFDAESYLAAGTFASTLPDDIQAQIRASGIRNSHLLSIAPTGTIAMAFGNNASSGLEPIFALTQRRTVRQLDGSHKEIIVRNRAVNLFVQKFGEQAVASWPAFVTATSLTVDEHIDVAAAAARHVDSAVSKTINVPTEFPFERFKDAYRRAWSMGLKGVTVYRPNPMVGTVLNSADGEGASAAQAQAPAGQHMMQDGTGDPDRRVRLVLDKPLEALTGIRNRPSTPHGVHARLFQVPHPAGEFAVAVSHWVNGGNHPLDLYVAGSEQPRGIAALAKLLSQDFRTEDPAWIRLKLESLLNTQGDDAFEMVHPATGKSVRMPSLVAGFAAIVHHSLTQIEAIKPDASEADSPMLQALFSRREPKTDSGGALGWHVDVVNPATGDDFLLVTKELRMPDGVVRPYSVWLSGRYPRVLDGLTKALSIDMRVSDPAWMIHKLNKLGSFAEANGAFMAQVPGEQRQQLYPSTVAYMAQVLLHRLRVLGVKPLGEAGASPSQAVAQTGQQCPSCYAMTLQKRDGCEVCDNCGHIGSCG